MFKKFTSAFIVIAMLASLFSFGVVFAEDELISSESFEDGLGTWVYWGSAKSSEPFISFVNDAKDGKKAVKMLDDSEEAGPGVSSPNFDVIPGVTYKVEFDCKLMAGGSLYGVALRFLDGSGKKVGDEGRSKLSANGEWNHYSISATAPNEAVTAIAFLAGNKKNVCEIYLDNVKIYGKKPSAPVAIGDSIFEDSFEKGLDNWKAFSKAGIEGAMKVEAVSGTTAGKYALHCIDNASEGDNAAPAIVLADYIAVQAGATYTATCDYKLVSGDSFKLILRYFDKDKKKLTDKTGAGKSNGWDKVTLTLPAPEGAESCAILVAGYSKNVGEAYIDNIKLVQTGAAPEIKEESKMDKINKSSIALFLGSANALVNGSKTLIDKTNDKVIADTVEGRTLVPVRFIAENYGAEVGWDDATKTVTLKMADKTATIVLDKKEITVGDKVIAIDVPAQTIEGRTMLPLRAFVEQVMGKTIFWDDRGLIVITDALILDAAADKAVIDEIIAKVK